MVSVVNDLLGLLARLGKGAAVTHIGQPVARMAYSAIFGLAALVFAIAGVACGLAALWIYMLPYAGPVGAPLVVSGTLFTLCFGMLALAKSVSRPRPAAPRDAGPEFAVSEAIQLLKAHKSATILGALLAGLAAGKYKD